MNISMQIQYVDLDKKKSLITDKLCGYLPRCPPNTFSSCENCIGDAAMPVLKEMEPKLDKDNLEATLKLWEILVK